VFKYYTNISRRRCYRKGKGCQKCQSNFMFTEGPCSCLRCGSLLVNIKRIQIYHPF